MLLSIRVLVGLFIGLSYSPTLFAASRSMSAEVGELITGEIALDRAEARARWQSSCRSWLKLAPTKHPEKKILMLTCGLPTCSEESAGRRCVSKATVKFKVGGDDQRPDRNRLPTSPRNQKGGSLK